MAGRLRALATAGIAEVVRGGLQGIAVLEGCLFVAAVFFVFCWTMARYGRWLEARYDVGHG